uniref:Uncharacterized protein n=1 Tax=Sus scrofa TaxID=9823 RepID=A0A8D0LT08_PIG
MSDPEMPYPDLLARSPHDPGTLVLELGRFVSYHPTNFEVTTPPQPLTPHKADVDAQRSLMRLRARHVYVGEIIAFDELRTDFKSPIDQCNPVHARERLRNIERICFLLRKLVLPEYSIHSLFCIMFLCAQEWLTLGLNVPLLFYHFWRYFHCPADSSELAYDPPVVMNADTLSYCQKEAWCKLAFYLLSFFYYLYCMIYTLVSS